MCMICLLAGAPRHAGGWEGAQFNTGPYGDPLENEKKAQSQIVMSLGPQMADISVNNQMACNIGP